MPFHDKLNQPLCEASVARWCVRGLRSTCGRDSCWWKEREMRYEHGVVEKGEQLVRSVREWARGETSRAVHTLTMHIRIIPVGTPRSAGLSEEEMIPILQDGGAVPWSWTASWTGRRRGSDSSLSLSEEVVSRSYRYPFPFLFSIITLSSSFFSSVLLHGQRYQLRHQPFLRPQASISGAVCDPTCTRSPPHYHTGNLPHQTHSLAIHHTFLCSLRAHSRVLLP